MSSESNRATVGKSSRRRRPGSTKKSTRPSRAGRRSGFAEELSVLNSDITFDPEVVAEALRDRRDEFGADQITIMEHLLDHARKVGACVGDEYGHPAATPPVPMPPRKLAADIGTTMEEAWQSRQDLVDRGVLICHVPGRPIGAPGWEDDGGSYSLSTPPEMLMDLVAAGRRRPADNDLPELNAEFWRGTREVWDELTAPSSRRALNKEAWWGGKNADKAVSSAMSRT
jgi:hypothetical protein